MPMIFYTVIRNYQRTNLKNYKGRSSCLLRSNFFSHRVVNAWNNLPQLLVETCSLNDFKAKLDMYWTDNMYCFIE